MGHWCGNYVKHKEGELIPTVSLMSLCPAEVGCGRPRLLGIVWDPWLHCQQPPCAIAFGTPVGAALHLRSGGAQRAWGWCQALSTVAVPKALVPGIALKQNQEQMILTEEVKMPKK